MTLETAASVGRRQKTCSKAIWSREQEVRDSFSEKGSSQGGNQREKGQWVYVCMQEMFLNKITCLLCSKSTAKSLLLLFWGHARQCSGPTPASVLSDHSQRDLGDQIGDQGYPWHPGMVMCKASALPTVLSHQLLAHGLKSSASYCS